MPAEESGPEGSEGTVGRGGGGGKRTAGSWNIQGLTVSFVPYAVTLPG